MVSFVMEGDRIDDRHVIQSGGLYNLYNFIMRKVLF